MSGHHPWPPPSREPEPQAEPEPRKRKKKRLPKVISGAEAAALMAACDNGTPKGTRDLAILELMYRAGLRVSEVVGLAPRDVEEDGLVRLYDAKGGDGTAYFDPGRIMPVLERWMVVRSDWGVADPTHLFTHRTGKPISTRYVQRLVKRLKAEIGVTGKLTPHVLRHTYATELIEEGLTLPEVSAALRHRNLATTAVYLWVRDEALRRKIGQRTSRDRLGDGTV